MITMHAGKGLYTSHAGKHGGLKPVFTFQTLFLNNPQEAGKENEIIIEGL